MVYDGSQLESGEGLWSGPGRYSGGRGSGRAANALSPKTKPPRRAATASIGRVGSELAEPPGAPFLLRRCSPAPLSRKDSKEHRSPVHLSLRKRPSRARPGRTGCRTRNLHPVKILDQRINRRKQRKRRFARSPSLPLFPSVKNRRLKSVFLLCSIRGSFCFGCGRYSGGRARRSGGRGSGRAANALSPKTRRSAGPQWHVAQ